MASLRYANGQSATNFGAVASARTALPGPGGAYRRQSFLEQHGPAPRRAIGKLANDLQKVVALVAFQSHDTCSRRLRLPCERGKIRPPREVRARAQMPLARLASHHITHVSFCKPARIGRRQNPQSGALRQCPGAPVLGVRRAAVAVDDGVLGAALNAAPAMPENTSNSSPKLPPILRFDNLTLGYDRHPAVHHLHGEIAAGSLLAIVGPNGAGKSTLLKGIAGELRPLQGRIHLQGVQRQQIAYLTQLTTLDSSFPMVVHDFVAMGLWCEIGAFGGLDRSRRQRIAAAIGVSRRK